MIEINFKCINRSIMKDNKLNPIGELKTQLNIPKTETRIILNDWQLETKKSKLSPAARNKVVSNNSYVSERTTDLVPSYGPCSTNGCPHSTSFKVHIDVPSKNWFSDSHRFIFDNNGSKYSSFTASNLGEAERGLRDFENGTRSVMFEGAFSTGEGGTLTSQKNKIVRRVLKDAIRDHKDYGNRIDIDRKLSRYSENE